MVSVESLVKKGYKQAAFSYKWNAEKFRNLWHKKGYKTEMFRSSGPTVEFPKEHVTNAYYVVAKKLVPTKGKPYNIRKREVTYARDINVLGDDVYKGILY